MATGQVQSICSTMKRFIESMKKEIKRKEDTIQRQQERLRKLTAQPSPDSAMVQEVRDDIARLERELIDDRGQLNVLEEEFTAACGS
jgi:predicted RNase H-like nuclease (RuvC/YqgF family)